ncbi:GlcG/HbpS family heme-binding protein [Crenalkalicoccus roseus]|uniref:GlcG/HbpS family heme-binding protein n=1 Tax=Crenalkalicoccus roseus TaxID=1485588 RepID=UPI0010801B3E|nr:heme-binding protein [Crenalkalicoccus roseus]
MRKPLPIAAAALLALAPAAGARGEDFTTFRVMSPPLALALAQAALKACHDRGYQVAVAVVDRFGVPQVMLRDALAGPHTPDTAIAKARTAVSFRAATEELSAATQAGQINSAIRHIPGYVFLGGGVPVEGGGAIVGGVGVSGAPGGPEDDACARAGIEAVEERLLM